jgi:hypothetical protein
MRNAGSDAIEGRPTIGGPGSATLGSRMVALARAAAALHMARLAQGDWTPAPDPFESRGLAHRGSVLSRRRLRSAHARRGAGG